jgi:Secretion system C-terminal sorting domain
MHYLSSFLISLGLLGSATLPTLAQHDPIQAARKPVSAAKAALHRQPHPMLPGTAARPTDVTVPGTSIFYGWDEAANAWANDVRSTISYSAAGLPTVSILSDSANTIQIGRVTYTYNAQQQLTEQVLESGYTGQYVNASRTVFTYDAQGAQTSFLFYDWTGTGWRTVYGYRSATTYNAANVLTQEVDEFLVEGKWEPNSRTTYTVDANNRWTEIIEEEWDSDTQSYVKQSRSHNIVWQDWTKRQPASFEEQAWNATTSAWVDEERNALSFQPNGSFVQISQEYDGTAWQNNERYTVTYDALGNFTLSQQEDWNGTTWQIEEANRRLLSYSPGNQLRRAVDQQYDTDDKRFENSGLTTYGSFLTLGIRRATGLEAAAQLYPNPTAGNATLRLSGLPTQETIPADVVNQLGQVVRHFTLRPMQGTVQQALPLADLPAGVYTVRLNTSLGTVAKRVVKQ